MPAHRVDGEALSNVIESANQRPLQPMFTYIELASALKVSVQTIELWVKRGKIPSPIYIGVSARFTLKHLEQIYAGVKPAHTYPVSDSPRAAQSRAGKTAKKQAKLRAARTIAVGRGKPSRSKATPGKGGGK